MYFWFNVYAYTMIKCIFTVLSILDNGAEILKILMINADKESRRVHQEDKGNHQKYWHQYSI